MIGIDNKHRLLKFANHLQFGELGQKRWHYSRVFNELPIVFPEEWYFGFNDIVECSLPPNYSFNDSIERFFGINYKERLQLFSYNISVDWLKYEKLKNRTPRTKVAKNIRKFIKWKQLLGECYE